MNLGVLVSGRGSNLQALLDAAGDGRIRSRIAVVLSDSADAPALERARAVGVPAIHVPAGSGAKVSKSAALDYTKTLREYEVDLVVLAGFMRIVGRTFFEHYAGRIVNIHPSLLPAFPGLDPQERALEAGVRVAGCTVHFVTPDVDAGPIVCQEAVAVADEDTVDTLSARILAAEHRMYVEAIRLIEAGRVRVEDGRARILPPASSAEGVTP